MCLHRNWFSTYQSIDDGVVFMGNDFSCKIVGVGSVRIRMHDGSVRTLIYVRHVLELRKNLISLGVLDSTGYNCTSQGGVLKVSKGILVVMKEKRIGNLYQPEGRTEVNQTVVASKDASDCVSLWHQRLGNMSKKGLKVLVDRKSLPSLKFLNLNFCKYCVFGKQCRHKFKGGRHIRKSILDYINPDVWGPSPTVSLGGSSYFVTFINGYSGKVWVYLLKTKVDVFNTFKQFRALVEKSTDRSIKCLRTNNGSEFTSVEFENYCKEAGIERHKSITYTPQHNGVVEPMNRTLLERSKEHAQ
jgi:hypothetical protein